MLTYTECYSESHRFTKKHQLILRKHPHHQATLPKTVWVKSHSFKKHALNTHRKLMYREVLSKPTFFEQCLLTGDAERGAPEWHRQEPINEDEISVEAWGLVNVTFLKSLYFRNDVVNILIQIVHPFALLGSRHVLIHRLGVPRDGAPICVSELRFVSFSLFSDFLSI